MNIEVSAREVTSRGPQIRKFLGPLVQRTEDLFVIPKPTTEEFIVAAHGRGFDNTGHYSDLRFRTVVPNFVAMYHERWKRFYVGKKEFYYLYRAYLHLYQIDAVSGQVEFLLLHCDPNEPISSAHATYKQGLHLHIECSSAEWPHDIWPHSHIGLNVAYLSEMLKDVNSLSRALGIAVVMIRDQVLDLLK